jgi:hypothetical protein
MTTDTCGTCQAKFGHDQLAKPQLGWIVVSLPMPDHSQGERGQFERFRGGEQMELCAKALNNGFLYTRNQITRRHSVQDRKAMWKCQPEAPPHPSCS